MAFCRLDACKRLFCCLVDASFLMEASWDFCVLPSFAAFLLQHGWRSACPASSAYTRGLSRGAPATSVQGWRVRVSH